MMSPVVVVGASALNAAFAVVFAVPPLAIGSTPDTSVERTTVDQEGSTPLLRRMTAPDPDPAPIGRSSHAGVELP